MCPGLVSGPDPGPSWDPGPAQDPHWTCSKTCPWGVAVDPVLITKQRRGDNAERSHSGLDFEDVELQAPLNTNATHKQVD